MLGRPAAGVAGPRDSLILWKHDPNVGLGPGIADDHVHRLDVGVRREPALVSFRVRDCRRKRDAAHLRREPLEPRHGEREQIAALAGGEGVHLVDDDRLEIREQQCAVFVAQEQAQGLGGGEQNLRRLHPLPRLTVGRSVAGAGLDADIESHLADRRQQVTLHIHGERLQRRHI